jgi:hypothetical protein
MSTAAHWYDNGLKHCLTDVNFLADTIKASFHTVSYVPSKSSDEFFSSVTNEVAGTGYTAGGITLTGKTASVSGGVVSLSCASPIQWTFATISGQIVVFRKDTGTAGTSPVLWWYDAGALTSSTSPSSLIVNIDPTGLITVTAN